MVLLLLSWLYILFIATGMGMLVYRKISRKEEWLFVVLIGFFINSLLTHFYSFFGGINWLFYGLNSILAAIGWIFNFDYIRKLASHYRKLPFYWASGLTLLLLMQTAVPPMLIDNDTYYIQTIQWLNQFGIVKGLANLHWFLSQFSAWHILQSSFNFGFISHPINSLNGFLLLAFCFYSLKQFQTYKLTLQKETLFIALLPIGNVLFYFFSSSPSPDLPIYLITSLIFYLFYRTYDRNENHFKLILVLSFFLFSIKVSIFPILFLSLILIFLKKTNTREIGYCSLVGLMVFSFFIFKNYILSGYPLFPIQLGNQILTPDWKLPEEILNQFLGNPRRIGVADLELSHEKVTEAEFFYLWLLKSNVHSIFNSLAVLLLVVFPFFIKRNKALIWLYMYGLIQFGLLYFSSPQYRFFLQIIIAGLLFILVKFFAKIIQKLDTRIYGLAFLPIFFLLGFTQINLSNQNTYSTQSQSFSIHYLIKPSKNSGLQFEYQEFEEGNLKYNSPISTPEMFWLNGEGDLPCTNHDMVEYIKTGHHLRPQLRTGNLKDGFYSQKLNP